MASSLYSITYQLKSHKRDYFIEFIKSLMLTPFILSTKPKDGSSGDADRNKQSYIEILNCLEELINDYISCSSRGHKEISRLYRLVPSIGQFFTSLPLVKAFEALEVQRSFVGRRFVPPSFNDIRYLLNHAQVMAIAPHLELITFDGDMTLYADGADFAHDSQLSLLLCQLLALNKKVAIVTAAGYPRDAKRYEKRLSGLLETFQSPHSGVSADLLANFYVLGGECNYLFQYSPKVKGLVYLDPAQYQPKWMNEWAIKEDDIQSLLECAQKHLQTRISELQLTDRVTVLRKSRAVGVNPRSGCELTREQLDELALSTQNKLNMYQMQQKLNVKSGASFIPFCAFNGGSDVWVDIGNKLIGVKVLSEYFSIEPKQTLHVGDQFLSTGNDIATRSACCTIWITSPEETQQVLVQLNKLLVSIQKNKDGDEEQVKKRKNQEDGGIQQQRGRTKK